jgi:hypothetical protein
VKKYLGSFGTMLALFALPTFLVTLITWRT